MTMYGVLSAAGFLQRTIQARTRLGKKDTKPSSSPQGSGGTAPQLL